MAMHCLKNSSAQGTLKSITENVQGIPSWFSNPVMRAIYSTVPPSSAEFNPLPAPPFPNSGKQKWAPAKGPNTLLFLFKMKNSSSILNMQEVGEGGISSSRLYICFYKICYFRLDHFGGQKKPGSEF